MSLPVIIEDLKKVDLNALHVVRTVLEARVGSAMNQTDNIELRSEVRRTYALLSRLIDELRNDVIEDEVTQVKKMFNI